MEFYRIIVKSHLSSRRTKTFSGMKIELLPDGQSALSGYLQDQIALYGIINKIQELGLQLVQVIVENEEGSPKSKNGKKV